MVGEKVQESCSQEVLHPITWGALMMSDTIWRCTIVLFQGFIIAQCNMLQTWVKDITKMHMALPC
eukprot:534217-Ditylum_brightwellii.AAC.1